MPAAIGAIIAFAIAFILYVSGGNAAVHWVDAALIGAVLLSVAMAFPGWWGIRGPRA